MSPIKAREWAAEARAYLESRQPSSSLSAAAARRRRRRGKWAGEGGAGAALLPVGPPQERVRLPERWESYFCDKLHASIERPTPPHSANTPSRAPRIAPKATATPAGMPITQ